MSVKTYVKHFVIIIDLSLFSKLNYLNLSIISPILYHDHILYFVGYNNCSIQQQKLETIRGLR